MLLDSTATPLPSSQELALSTLMKFVQLEGAHPLEKPKWEGNYLFPRQLFKVRAQWGPSGLLWLPAGMAGWSGATLCCIQLVGGVGCQLGALLGQSSVGGAAGRAWLRAGPS